MLSAAPQQVGQEEFANCCDTPAYCSSVRRCTRLDEAKPQQPAEAVAGEFHECPHCKGWSRTPPPAIDIGKLRELYDAAGKGFHISETCGPDGKYWHVSKFPDMASLHAFVDAWTAVMRAMRDAK